jgi:hypothetical protein
MTGGDPVPLARSSRPPRSGAIVAATWLIGLGLIFLIRDAAGWTWPQAWPMFVILVGVGMLASSFAYATRQWAGSWWLVWPVAWIGIGFVLLMSTTGKLGVDPDDLVSQWWPAIPIGIGIWFLVASVWPGRRAPVEQLDLALGGAQEAHVRIRFGAGELQVEKAPSGRLVSGTFAGGVHVVPRGAGAVELEPDMAGGWPGWDRPFAWRLGLTGDVPLELRVESGAARASLDLHDLMVRRLDLKTGASDTRVRLPRAAGMTTVRAETGAAALTIEVPDGVAARIRSQMALGSTQVNELRFPRSGGGYASADWETAANRVDLDLQGGVGSIRIL